jgi:hypothetical protein
VTPKQAAELRAQQMRRLVRDSRLTTRVILVECAKCGQLPMSADPKEHALDNPDHRVTRQTLNTATYLDPS